MYYDRQKTDAKLYITNNLLKPSNVYRDGKESLLIILRRFLAVILSDIKQTNKNCYDVSDIVRL